MAKGEKTVSLRAYDAVDDIVDAVKNYDEKDKWPGLGLGADHEALLELRRQIKAILKKHGFGPKDW